MDQRIIDFLTKERVCSLTTILPDGSPHSAAMHYSFKEDPFEIYFSTNKTSRKAQKLLSGDTKASFVIGLSEEEMVTLQIQGNLKMVNDEAQLQIIKQNHYSRNPSSQRFESDPNTVFMIFTPSWWRYMDYKTKPLTVISSES